MISAATPTALSLQKFISLLVMSLAWELELADKGAGCHVGDQVAAAFVVRVVDMKPLPMGGNRRG
jgi:uncharacterized membrane protein